MGSLGMTPAFLAALTGVRWLNLHALQTGVNSTGLLPGRSGSRQPGSMFPVRSPQPLRDDEPRALRSSADRGLRLVSR